MREQSMSRGQIDDAPATEGAADPARHLPRFVQLLARQTPGFTHRPPNPIEDARSPEPPAIAYCQPPT